LIILLKKEKTTTLNHTGTKKQVFLTFITNHGIVPNAYASEIVDAEIRLEQLLNLN
jgi:hypothetical protein